VRCWRASAATAIRTLGTVVALYRYPVKSLRAEPLTRAEVLPEGFAGDRARALFVRSPDHARTGKTYRGKEQRCLHTVDAVADAQTIARAAGVTIEAADERPHYFDAEPISLVFDRWLDELAVLVGHSVEALRFRPNIVAAAAAGFASAERDLVGRRLRIGDVVLDVASPITRCVTPSYDLVSAVPDPEFQRRLVTQRENLMGIYCRVAVAGTIETGATIETNESG